MYATYRRTPLGRLIRKTFAEHPGGTFLDIGANLGIYSLIAHAAGARTVLFEPEPHHAAFLQRNPAVFQRVYDCALSNRDGNAILNVAIDSKPGISSLAGQATDSIYATTTEVGLQSLDSILAANPTDPLWTTIPLIKIDVEGHEVETVEGMQGFLAGGRCRYIWCEVRGPRSRRATDSCSKVNEIMAHAGYRPFWTNHRRPQPFAGAKRLPQVFDLLYMRP
jgi:FkbM family methyltransferase